MELNLTHQAAGYRQQHKRVSIWKKVTMILASVVVFCTTYALILPAIMLEQDTVCGLDEHTHVETCYSAAPSVAVTELFCDRDGLALHSHDESCLDENDLPVCGYADFVIHRHDAICYDGDGLLQCGLPEIEPHTHGESCWQQPHVHAEACYTAMQGELLCPVIEGETHAHTDGCYLWTPQLTCVELTAQEGAQATLVCELDEIIAHTHGERCYTNGVLTCGQTEVLVHTHCETACYRVILQTSQQLTLSCEQEEHSHVDSHAGNDQEGINSCILW